jgi:WD40 repeat protein
MVKWAKRRPAVASLLAVLILAVIGFVVVGILFSLGLQDALEVAQDARGKAESAREHADEQKTLAQKEKAEADAARIEAEWSLYASRISLAQLYWRDDSAAGAFEALDACRPDFRGWEHRFLWTLFNSNQKTLVGHSDGILCLAVSRDGSRLATGSNDKTVKVWDAATGRELVTLAADTGPYGRVLGVAYSPNGKLLASAGNGEAIVKIWDAATGQRVRDLNGHTAGITAVDFSPDGQRLASGSYDHKVKVWDVASGNEVTTLTGHRLPIMAVAFSPDGKRLASGSDDSAVKVWDIATRNQVFSLGSRVSSLAFSRDGQRLAGSSGDKVKVWNAITGQELITLKATGGQSRPWPSVPTASGSQLAAMTNH